MLTTLSIRPVTPEQTYSLRHSVLWPDKSPAYIKVENDTEGYHFGGFRQDELIAVISLFVADEVVNPGGAWIGRARFRKFAVHPDYQHQGIGTLLLNHVIAEAKRLGAASLWCDARMDAADFYQRFGMKAVSEVFYKGPIPYARFSRTL
ncbi:GNAT family N-acetyltransferase [Spirosoma spitsbergense]|uniref:GNAT family N-acetyltransferase n=1 Tax=Spirosoma spitsbergense TaxID=431554 RepID=UPI0003693C4B|nr:GNAT family N-acetyltransferase [Spirosoma spitsbergense]